MSKGGTKGGNAPAATKKASGFDSATTYAKPQASNPKVAGLNPGSGKVKSPVGR